MSTTPEAWWFSKPHLERAVEIWRTIETSSIDAVDAFYEWCLLVVDEGPPEVDTMPIPDTEDAYVSYVPEANVYVTYLAVFQDRSVFVRSIERAV